MNMTLTPITVSIRTLSLVRTLTTLQRHSLQRHMTCTLQRQRHMTTLQQRQRHMTTLQQRQRHMTTLQQRQRHISVFATKRNQEKLEFDLKKRFDQKSGKLRKIIYTESEVSTANQTNKSSSSNNTLLDNILVLDYDRIKNLLDDAENLKVSEAQFLDAVYSSLLKLEMLQDGKQMEKILKLLLSWNVNVPAKITHILLKYYALNGPVQSAENLLVYCKKSNLELDEDCFGEMIDVYANANLPWKTLDVLSDMEKLDIPVSLRILNRVVRGFGKAKLNKGIQITLEMIKKKGFGKNQNFYNAMLNAMKQSKNFEQSIALFEEMKKASKTNRNLVPNVATFAIMMEVFAKKGDLQSACTILENLVASETKKLDAVLFNIILHSFRMKKNYAQVEYYYQLMLNCNIHPSYDTYSVLISMYGLDQLDLPKAMEVYNHMLARDMLPNRFILALLMTASAKNGKISQARTWYKVIQERGMVPTDKILMACIQIELLDPDVQNPLPPSLFFFDLAKKLGVVSQDLCRSYLLVHLISSTPLPEALRLFRGEAEKLNGFKYLVHPKTLLMVCDYILRHDTFRADHVEMHEHTLRPAESIQRRGGKAEFEWLVQNAPPLPPQRLRYMETALSYLD